MLKVKTIYVLTRSHGQQHIFVDKENLLTLIKKLEGLQLKFKIEKITFDLIRNKEIDRVSINKKDLTDEAETTKQL